MTRQGLRLERRRIETIPSGLEGQHPILGRIYAARGVVDAADVDHSLHGLLRTGTLGGLDRATDLLADTLREDRRIVIVADFDADGATSCVVAIRGLRACGARHVDYVVPSRFRFGYGLTEPIVKLACAKGADLLITVDNGISSLDGVAAAKAAGLSVLITDHHLPGQRLPAADAIVNPNLPGDAFPSKALAGVGVVFYVLLALRAKLRGEGWFAAEGLGDPNFAELLDLVALGTVADVVPLDANNRRLVAQGLARIRAGRACAGIRTLLQVAGRDPARVLASDLGFAVGPRLNAAGRLADMSLGIECLLADDVAYCTQLARELDRLNRERRELERDMHEQALEQVLEALPTTGELPHGICVFDPSWHQGVVGIVAGRVKERYHRPTIAFAVAEDEELKGSGRSIPGIHIRDVLDCVAARHPDLLSRFGGHAMAAGLSLRRADYARFAAAFDTEIARVVAPELLLQTLYTDGELAVTDMTLDLARLLAAAAPWGQAFPEPLFDGAFGIRRRRVVRDEHLQLDLVCGGSTFEAIAFNAAAAEWADASAIRAAYRLAVNEWRGVERLQLVIVHAESI